MRPRLMYCSLRARHVVGRCGCRCVSMLDSEQSASGLGSVSRRVVDVLLRQALAGGFGGRSLPGDRARNAQFPQARHHRRGCGCRKRTASASAEEHAAKARKPTRIRCEGMRMDPGRRCDRAMILRAGAVSRRNLQRLPSATRRRSRLRAEPTNAAAPGCRGGSVPPRRRSPGWTRSRTKAAQDARGLLRAVVDEAARDFAPVAP